MAGALWNNSKESCLWDCGGGLAPKQNEFRFAGGEPSRIPDQEAIAAVVVEAC